VRQVDERGAGLGADRALLDGGDGVGGEALDLSLDLVERARLAECVLDGQDLVVGQVGRPDAGQDLPLGRIRITYTGGPAPLGSGRGAEPPTLVVVADRMKAWEGPTEVVTVPWPRNEQGALAGLKTTFGRISVAGVRALAPSLDTVGPMAADVARLEEGMRLLDPTFGALPDPTPVLGRARLGAAPWVEDAVDKVLRAARVRLQKKNLKEES